MKFANSFKRNISALEFGCLIWITCWPKSGLCRHTNLKYDTSSIAMATAESATHFGFLSLITSLLLSYLMGKDLISTRTVSATN
ncbi:MAG: hypothetical protein LKF37_09020 [Lentilactobacillus diolivorans]|nr:hypothetical protein [Lentilactobacillus diolivorans]